MGRRKLGFVLLCLAFAALLPLALFGIWGGSSTASPLLVHTPPSVIPSRGVEFSEATLFPAPVSSASMTEAQALALARTKYGVTGNVRAVLASLTVPGTFDRPTNDPLGGPIRKRAAWILTKTYAKPVQLPGMTIHYGRYNTIAIDAVTGKFLIGYRY